MQAVADTSPLIFLEALDALYLLSKCFEKILIPEAVYEEWAPYEVPFFMECPPLPEKGRAFVDGEIGRLHQAELETIVLARELGIKFVLMDDLLARRKAVRMDLIPIGTLGILKLALLRDILTPQTVQRFVNELTAQHGMYL